MTTRARYVLLGVGGIVLAVAVGMLVALVLRSLAAGPARVEIAAPTAAPPAANPLPTEPAPGAAPEGRPEAGRNECVDALGDGDVDLDSVRLELDHGDLVVQFRFAGALPPGEAGFGLTIERNGGAAFLLGVALNDGEVDEVFVRDFDRSDQNDIDTDNVTVDGTFVTAVFPKKSIKSIGNDWRWAAFANVSGGVLDSCPNHPALQRFDW